MHLSPNGLVLLVWAVVPKLQLVNGVKLGRLALALRRDWCAESMGTASQDNILRKKVLLTSDVRLVKNNSTTSLTWASRPHRQLLLLPGFLPVASCSPRLPSPLMSKLVCPYTCWCEDGCSCCSWHHEFLPADSCPACLPCPWVNKGLTKFFSELLEMKDTIKTMCRNMR